MEMTISQKHIDLALAYSKAVVELGIRSQFMRNDDIIEIVLRNGAPRFYISFEAALQYMRQFFSGGAKQKDLPKRRKKMWEDLRRNVESHIKLGLNLNEAIQKAIDSPAPSFYITHKRARNMVSYIRIKAPWLLMQYEQPHYLSK